MARRFLIWLSGVKPQVLKTCPSEQTKFVSVGGTVLTTALMAVVSCTFALHMALGLAIVASVVAGLAWGFAILNLDRYLVASTVRQDRFLQNLAVVLPRLLLAILLGFVIAEPLVLRIFSQEIAAEQQVINQEKRADFESRLTTDPRFVRLERDKERVAALEAIVSGKAASVVDEDPAVKSAQARVDQLEGSYADAEKAVIGEKEGTSGSGKAGAGIAYAEKVAARDRIGAELSQARAQLNQSRQQTSARLAGADESRRTDASKELATLSARVIRTEAERDGEQATFTRASRDDNGLLARMEALDHLAGRDGALAVARWLLTLCFIAIDCLPVLVKLFMSVGKPSLYDRMLRLHEDSELDAAEGRFQGIRESHEFEVQGFRDQQELRRKLETEAAQRIAEHAVRLQAELAEEALQQWKERERLRMLASLDDFIETETAVASPAGDRTDIYPRS